MDLALALMNMADRADEVNDWRHAQLYRAVASLTMQHDTSDTEERVIEATVELVNRRFRLEGDSRLARPID